MKKAGTALFIAGVTIVVAAGVKFAKEKKEYPNSREALQSGSSSWYPLAGGLFLALGTAMMGAKEKT
jgi:hypothetical protein